MEFLKYHLTPTVTNNSISIADHLGGFDSKYFSPVLNNTVLYAKKINITNIRTSYIFDSKIQKQYPDITFCYDQSLIGGRGWETLSGYKIHPELNYKNFICSFNGSSHVSRKLLVAILQKFEWFNPEYCSKNFVYTSEILDGHINDYVKNQNNFYNKFFIEDAGENFCQTINSFGHIRFDHIKNIYNLEKKITQSFLHIVSETMATSYYPWITEKLLYSIVTRGLFLSYAAPGWHAHFEKYYGFKLYHKLFDYRFDSIQNPVERLVELMTMISKFSKLSAADWRDLYLLEQDTIEYNYSHYYSQDYLKKIKHNE